MKIATVQNSNGLAFTVRIVETGQPYGLKMQLTNEKEYPLIEFYDKRYEFDSIEGIILGQFVTRYNLESIRGRTTGLNLDGGIPDWTLDRVAMLQVQNLINGWEI